MKLIEVAYLLGLRPRPRRYGTVVDEHFLPDGERIEIAHWLHPRAYRAVPSAAILAQLRRFLRPGDVAIDIGAHAGDTALPMALTVGPGGAVIALEPNPYVHPVLAANAALNPGRVRIIPYPFAAMREAGTYQFHYGEPGFCNGGFHEGLSRWRHRSAFTVEVEGRNLAELMAREHPDLLARLRFIKVDTEGFDLAVLETLDAVLAERRPILQVEMFSLKHAPGGYREQLYHFLVQRRYDLFRVDGDRDFFAEAVTPANLLRWQSCDVCCVPEESRATVSGLPAP